MLNRRKVLLSSLLPDMGSLKKGHWYRRYHNIYQVLIISQYVAPHDYVPFNPIINLMLVVDEETSTVSSRACSVS